MSDFVPMSLADFAQQSTDDVAVVMSRLPDEGTFTVIGEAVTITMTQKTPEDSPLFTVAISYIIQEAALPPTSTKDPESYIDRRIQERVTLWPDDFRQALGLLKGMYRRIGLPTDGAPGGIPEVPGWLDGIAKHPFSVRIRHFTDKNGTERAGYDWKRVSDEIYAALGVPNPFAPDAAA